MPLPIPCHDGFGDPLKNRARRMGYIAKASLGFRLIFGISAVGGVNLESIGV